MGLSLTCGRGQGDAARGGVCVGARAACLILLRDMRESLGALRETQKQKKDVIETEIRVSFHSGAALTPSLVSKSWSFFSKEAVFS